jgi:parvulin-like peptidyl-prolyl isomerase
MPSLTRFRAVRPVFAPAFGCCLWAGLLVSSLSAWQQTSPPPTADPQMQIMAVVNGQQITRQQLTQETVNRFGESVAESLVNKYLITVECQKQGIRVTEADVDAEIEKRARKFGMSAERYISLICSERDLQPAKLRNEIIWTELALRRLASSLTNVSDEDIQRQLESEYGPKVQVRAIAVNDAEQAQKLLAQARSNPEQFSRLAINHSVDTNSASVGGLLPPLRRNMGEPELEQAAFALQLGEISGVLPMQDQFVILKCERHYPATELGQQDRLLAMQRIREEIRESRLGDAAEQLFRQMQDNAEIVNVINDPRLRQQMPGVATTVNGQPVTMRQIEEECLVRFGRDVLQSEINRTLIMQRLQQVGEAVTEQDLQQEIARAARDYGVLKADGTPDIEKWKSYVTQNDSSKAEIYIQDEVWPTVAMKKIVARDVQVTDEDMQKGFEANFGPRVEVLAVVLQDQRTAQKVWEMAKSNPTEKYFGELAHQYSIEPASRAHYGEVPPIQKHGGRKILEEEAFRLKPGEISGLIPVGNTWIVLWCKGRTTPVVEEFDAVRDELYRDILEKKLRIAMAEEFKRLQSQSQIDNFLVGSSQPGARAVQAARQQTPGQGKR